MKVALCPLHTEHYVRQCL